MKKYLILIFVLIVIFASGCTTPPAPDSSLNVTGIQKITALSKPATVMIVTVISGTVTIPTATLDEYTGTIVPTDESYSRDVQTGVIGSGFVISSDGYMLTNAHVVSFSDDVITAGLLEAAVAEEIKAGEAAGGLTEAEKRMVSDYVYQYGEVSGTKVSISAVTGVPVSGVGSVLKEYKADVRKVGVPAPGKDVAIIKVDQNNMPTVKLGDSSKMEVGDRIYAVGYPAVATFHEYISPESITEPSITQGIVSAEKQMVAGFKVLQIDAAVTHGNSGGPVFNDNGEVVGIATFGSIDYSTWQEIQGFNFMIPINLAKEFMSEINVANMRGSVDEHYEKGMMDYWKGDYSKALDEFNIVRNLYPAHPYVEKYIQTSQEKLLATTGSLIADYNNVIMQ